MNLLSNKPDCSKSKRSRTSTLVIKDCRTCLIGKKLSMIDLQISAPIQNQNKDDDRNKSILQMLILIVR